jgi:hypothetical protein
MAHFAKVENGIVTEVIVVEKEVLDTGLFGDPSLWIQTSYNTHNGVYYNPSNHYTERTVADDQSKALRANYAGVGYTYDAVNDVFYKPRPKDRNGVDCESWTISAPTWDWVPPVPEPKSTELVRYLWDEPTKTWMEFNH